MALSDNCVVTNSGGECAAAALLPPPPPSPPHAKGDSHLDSKQWITAQLPSADMYVCVFVLVCVPVRMSAVQEE